MKVQRDIAYGALPDQRLDLYMPEAAEAAPLIVFLHGGGWTHGSKRNARPMAQTLVAAGFAVASLDYGLLPHTRPRRLVQDCADGAAHVLQHAAEFGIRGDRFVLFGHSAGGHLAALLAADAVYLRHAGVRLTQVAGVVTMDGIFDLASSQVDRHMRTAGVRLGNAPGAKLSFSPMHLVTGMVANPKFLLLHGERPQYLEQATGFESVLTEHGYTVARHVLPRLSHMEMTTRFGMSGTDMEDVVLAWLRTVFGAG